MAAGGKGGSKGGSSGSKPNGAILDDTAEVNAMRKQRFDAWKKGYRETKLKPDSKLEMIYNRSPKP